MANTSKNLKRIYPLYLVIDNSGSMDHPVSITEKIRRIDLAKNFPRGIYQLYEENQQLVANLRVCVMTFNNTVQIQRNLAPVSEVLDMNMDWNPSGKTYFANLFSSIHQQVEEDRRKLSADYDLHNPAIVIFTDGIQSDNEALNENDQSRLTNYKLIVDNPNFNQKIQIVMYGVAGASKEFLELWATHPDLAVKPDKNLPFAKQLEFLIIKLKETLRNSLTIAGLEGSFTSSEGWVDPSVRRKSAIDDEMDDLW